MHNYLIMTPASQDTLDKFYNNWGINWEWTKSGTESENNNGTLAHENNLLLEHLMFRVVNSALSIFTLVSMPI